MRFKVIASQSEIAFFQCHTHYEEIGRFDLDFFTKCCVLQANSVKIDQNGLPDPLIVILYLKGFS